MIGSKIALSSEVSFDNAKFIEYVNALRGKYLRNNKVLLIQAPQFLFDSFDTRIAKNRGYYAYPPTGLQCIARALSNKGLDVEIFDLNYELLKKVISDDSFDYHSWSSLLDDYLKKNDPSVICVTCISVYTNVFDTNHPLTLVLKHLRERDREMIIAGGPISTNEYKNYLIKDLAHFVVEGEGENKINFFFDNILGDNHAQAPVNGIYFKFNGGIEQTQGFPDKVELKGNLIDTYKSLPIEDYNNAGSLNPYSRMAGQEKKFSVFQLNRGCRANCKFCGVPEFMGRGIRHYPVKDVLDEIRYLVEKRGIRHFDALDDDLLVSKKEFVGLLKGLVELRNTHDITWSSNNGLIASSITEELMALIRDSGCIGFRIGIESGNSQMLKNMRKPANISLLRKTAAILNKFPEVFSGGNYIIGLLGEERFKEMLDTFKFMCELNLDWASIAVFQFTSSAAVETERLRRDNRQTTDFQPTKYSARGEIRTSKDVVWGPEIFDLALDLVPSHEQLKEIWFSFNLVANYINNKNLKQDGRPEKFTSWVEAVRKSYPYNPYMSLFAGLGRVLLRDSLSADRHIDNTRSILRDSEYWDRRFSQFKLNDILRDFPKDAAAVEEALQDLRKRYIGWVV